MVAIPPKPEQQIIDRVYAAIQKEKADPDLYLGRLGSSSIGEECVRQVWLSWRGFAREAFDGRMLRLFETGHQQEARIVADLRRAGFAVWDKQPDGRQYEFTDPTGHFITKVDGVIKNVPESDKPHLLEIKTHNKNSFSSLLKKGVQGAKPSHYAQMQISMALGGFTRGLYVAVCKDDETLYVERIREDPAEQAKLQQKIIKFTEARLRPAGISDDGSSFGCKFCSMKAVCVKETPPLQHCRTCRMCAPGLEGKWVCELNNHTLTLDEQRKGCEHYEAL
ncbi:MAG: oxidoreductase [Micrococcales bacterium]|nr:oxidoreductase [Micrococcales bacterium]